MVSSFRRLLVLAGLAGATALLLRPHHDAILRFGLPLALAAAWLGVLGFCWRRQPLRVLCLALPAVVALPFLLPGRPLEARPLRDDYLAALAGMEGAPYVWGGESPRGIDCSGLPRRALRDALWRSGLRSANGTAFREWVGLWWYDTSAKALAEHHRGFTRPTGVEGKLRDLDFRQLAAGDLGITADGRHVMVFLGGDAWIQADPGPLQVTIGKPAEDPNPWFDADVRVQRWALLE